MEKVDHPSEKAPTKPSDMDDLLDAMKPFGRYQIWLTAVYLYAMFPLSVNNGFMAFNSPAMFTCSDNYNTSLVPTGDCQVYYNCSPGNLTFHVDFFSPAHQFGLICDQSYFSDLLTSIQMAGDLVGALVIGYLSDTYGRKPTLIIIMAVQMLLGCLSALSPNWPVFAVFRFLIGCCAGAEMVAGWVLVAECTTNRYRFLIRALAAATIAQFDQTLVAYLTQNWKWYAIVGNLQGVPLLGLLIFCIYESPRWLAQKGRVDAAKTVLKKIASINKTSHCLPEKLELPPVQPGPQTKSRPWHLFKTSQLRLYTFISVATWFIISTVYYGMYFNVGFLPANVYLSFLIMSAIGMLEVPLAIYDAYNPKMNRKWTLLTAFIFVVLCNAGTSVLLTCATSDSFSGYAIIVSVVSVIGQLATSVVFDQAYLVSVELFPTLLRSTAGSLCSVGARVGAVIAPQILYLREFWVAAPYVLFAGVSLVGVGLDIVFLPNTKGQHLPDSVG